MKNICVFGASGRTGLEFIKMALKNPEYKVWSVVRSENSAQKIPKGSEIIIGDTNSQAFIDECVENSDMVISLIGHGKNSPENLQTDMIRKIMSAMQKHGVKRLLSLTGTGVRKPGDKIPIYDKIGNYIIKKIDPKRIEDGINHAELIEKSGLDWTILKVLKLSNFNFMFPIEKRYELREHGAAKFIVSRKTVAYKIIEILENEEWFKKYATL
jgi:putative NADH-flavin reductase